MSSLSRGPILGVVVALLTAGLLQWKKVLFSLVAVCGIAVCVLVARPDILEPATRWFGQVSGERERAIVLDRNQDNMQVHSSSMSRVLLLQHYWKAVRHAGMTGYGMTATNGFPPNVPFVPIDQLTGKPYPLVDNSYVLLTLRGGWMQCLAFVLLHAAAIFQFSLMNRRDSSLTSFSRLMIGAISAHSLVVFTVYPDYDFMFVFLWTVGISSVAFRTDSELD